MLRKIKQNSIKYLVVFLMMVENCILNVDVENRDLVNVFLMIFGRPF